MSETADSGRPFDSTDLLALPVLPAVVGDLLAAFGDDQLDLQRLTQLIRYDAVLSARMLTVTNSVAYARQAPRTASLEQSLTILGLDTARAIVTTTALCQSPSFPYPIPTSELNRFWRHSLACAQMARRLAEMTGYPDPDEAYLGGLLHDLGQLIIGVRHAGVFREVRVLAPLQHEIPNLERRLFGADHCELGAALVDAWKLNSFLADAIRFHHLSAEELRGTHPLLRLLHVANTLSQEEEPRQDALLNADRFFSLPPALLMQARAEVDREMKNLASDLNVVAAVVDVGGDTVSTPAQAHLRQTLQEQSLINEVRMVLCPVDDEITLLDAIVRCVAILFNLPEAHFFLHDPATGMLCGRENDGRLREIVIDPAVADNVVNRAWQEQQIVHSFGEKTAKIGIIDYQLSRLWGTEGVLSLPLHTSAQSLGVLGIGISSAQLARLLPQTRLLRLFARAAATALEKLRQHEVHQRRVQEDRALLEQQRLRAALHEISNPITIVRNYLYLLSTELEPPVAQEELRVLREETERVSRILLRLGHSDETGLERSCFDLNGTIRDLARVLSDTLCRPRGIRLQLQLMDDLPLLEQGRDAVRQILLNLVRNASEALEPNGIITVSTQDRVNLQGQQYVEMTVADDGPGLPSALRTALFQPVASTKGSDHAGLGLAIVKNLVEELDGHIICRSTAGGGAEFLVLLPRS